MNLLLASTSKLYGQSYLEYLQDEIPVFFKHIKQITFIPFARPSGLSFDQYTALARQGFESQGIEVVGIHKFANYTEALEKSEAIFTGGGNTFLLLKTLYETGVLPQLKERIMAGMPYMGSSAGTNIAGLTIGTTNDMPIVYPPSFEALACVPFNINPHYLDPIPDLPHMGETRETRIFEFHTQNPQPVVGLREGSWLHVTEGSIHLKGKPTARIFKAGEKPYELESGDISKHVLI